MFLAVWDKKVYIDKMLESWGETAGSGLVSIPLQK